MSNSLSIRDLSIVTLDLQKARGIKKGDSMNT